MTPLISTLAAHGRVLRDRLRTHVFAVAELTRLLLPALRASSIIVRHLRAADASGQRSGLASISASSKASPEPA